VVLILHGDDGALAPAVEAAVCARRRHGQHGLQALPHHARLLGPSQAAELDHVLAEGALAAVGAHARLALLAAGPSPARPFPGGPWPGFVLSRGFLFLDTRVLRLDVAVLMVRFLLT